MKTKKILFGILLMSSIISLNSCADDMFVPEVSGCIDSLALNFNQAATTDDGSCVFIVSTTQEDIDKSVNPLALFDTGPVFSASIGHNGQMPDQGNQTTFRSSFTSLNGPNLPIKTGTIFTKKTYLNKEGVSDTLQAFFGMIKREPGYWPDGGDFEYWMSMYNKSMVDTLKIPMGMLPPMVDDMMRGKIMMCAGCHADPGTKGDFIFNY